MITLATVLLPAALLAAADEPRGGAESGRDELRRFLTERAGSYEFSTADGANSRGTVLQRTGKPVLRYTAPAREFLTGGAMFLWLDGERPVAAGSFWVQDDGQSKREFSNLVDQPLICRDEDGEIVWAPKGGAGVKGAIPDAAAPAKSKALRLAQMRSLARRFSATFYRLRDGEAFRLRLMPQPVCRYVSADHGVLDAAIFVLAESNDPDLLVTITAYTRPRTDGSRWSYSLARMCSMKMDVKLDNVAIHTFPHYWANPRTKADPYVEDVDGRFAKSDNDE